ncbi:hypothetical protein UFOVP964_119 [uncultured Caudovirales phage]|uniref:Uncharacterized protein n=1 Tax=uncultured Caudovirales phage TaxID=2100421 RepID=A0A6J5Q6A0_9CAUD|nr:hypothetical protein UFOVP854_119 [uncultured Caudovirales phage]CAB4175084.1 hypothetical protein UFOVP964_119 [uncultured Caudovirales phage]CAB4179151.1 hypothetical protein UFOVP1034_39 [uncultured Caudovirales phage]CAB4189083.1 hypothetical protein UFOVP1177_39 [uncultured Caudovirales phage]CAB4193122.1 hypothetical protein UFOVP1243_26 [uncultured Caudovirales phage]
MEQLGFDYHAAMTAGHTYNEIVAQRLISEGIGCSVPELELVTSNADISRLTKTEKDIILDNGLVLEVKSRNLGFSEDPKLFWQKDIYVDTVSGYEAKEIKPYAYVMVSQKSGNMLVVHSSTKDKWFKKTVTDPYRKVTDSFYKIEKQHLTTWTSLINELQGA